MLDTRPLYAVDAATPAALDERRSKPRLPIVTDVMGDEPVVRVIAGDDAASAFAGLTAWTEQVVDWLRSGHQPYVFAHQPENRDSPALARRFHAAVAERVPDLTPLPQPLAIDRSDDTDQASLF